MILHQNTAEYGWGDVKVTLRSRWPIAILIGSFVLLLGAWLSWKMPPVYESEAQVAIEEVETTSPVQRSLSEARPSSLNAVHRAGETLTSGKLLLQVVEKCHLVRRWNQPTRAGTLALLRSRVKVASSEIPGVFTIRAQDVSREGSSDIAGRIAESFVEMEERKALSLAEEKVRNLEAELRLRRENQKEMEERLVELRDEGSSTIAESGGGEIQDLRSLLIRERHLIRSLDAKHQLALVELQNTSSGASVLKLPVADDATAIDSRPLRLAVFGIVGLLIGCAVTLLISVGKSPLEIASELSGQLDLQLMGYAPVGFGLHPGRDGQAEWIEPYRDLRNKLHRLPAGDSSVLLFLPGGEDSHCAETVSQTAAVIADSGQSALLIDANFRDPQLHSLFHAARHPGLADFLSGEMRIEETVVKTRFNNLWLMPSGPLPRDPSGLVNGKRMDDLFWEMKSRFDYLLVTAPSIHRYSDAGAISAFVDHVVVVTNYHTHNLSRLKETRQAIEACRSTLSGVILSRNFAGPANKSAPAGDPEVPDLASLHRFSPPRLQRPGQKA